MLTAAAAGALIPNRASPAAAAPKSRSLGYAVALPDADWRARLTPAQYFVLREGGTEPPFTSPLENEKRRGTFRCAGCETPLFRSEQKFNSGTGWPSFARGEPGVEVAPLGLLEILLTGAELRCATCGGHLGDVFADGFLYIGTAAALSGQRYCIDGAALVFFPDNGDPPVVGEPPASRWAPPSPRARLSA
jgi:peptide-methionine (R)-S-oxide reductase